MSDSIPGSSQSNPIRYRGWNISLSGNGDPIGEVWEFWSDAFDGAPDSPTRYECGTAASEQEAKRKIDDMYDPDFGRALSQKPEKRRVTHLTVQQQYAVECASVIFNKAHRNIGYGLYQVGSSLTRQNWRDVDLRCIVGDVQFDEMFRWLYSPQHLFMNVVISEWFERRTGLPVDFQFQRQTEANAEFSSREGHRRNCVGIAIEASWNEDRDRKLAAVKNAV